MAVYTEVSEAEFSSFLGQYDLGSLKELTPIAEGVENTNYRAVTESGKFILTLFEKRVNEADLPFFMALKAHLAEQGLPVPAPIKNNAGGIVGRLNGRPAVLVEFLNGSPNMTPDQSACFELGHMLGQLHCSVSGFEVGRKNPLSIDGWKRLAAECKDADNIHNGLAKTIEEELSYLESIWPEKIPAGVIHADLFPDNVLFDKGNISGLIDFYFACTDFLAYDLAVCLNAWCFDKQSKFLEANAVALLSSYAKARAITGDELAAMPALLRGAAMRFLLTRAYDWLNQESDAIVTVKDPLDYARILAFHKNGDGKFLKTIQASK